ncbi:GNAT family N-acetyltransferase [Hymenobacter sp. HMF4947]|uniref:GNAT family N-acetyltransferase n=1 Tax=Hymenobacter ginkgonis TaxID=2682976 RepID=A0A7K1TAC3_9BACT|nr:GNAT family N-acetyltransferase [Hymenobacter ginkgonis]MVN75339.1 GNAT family N-acetyltransferase [Hymenobacter ginkgonis]
MASPPAPYIIRDATPADVAPMLAIYAPFVAGTTISFEYEVPTLADFAGRVQKVQRSLPWLVAESNGQVIGYAYASAHRERAAYQWSADSSVYVQAAHHGAGVARQLYAQLFARLTQLGYVNVYAGITQPNPRSEGFHRACGFEPVGTYRQVGYKFGQWHDVQWLAKQLRPAPAEPVPPRAYRPA